MEGGEKKMQLTEFNNTVEAPNSGIGSFQELTEQEQVFLDGISEPVGRVVAVKELPALVLSKEEMARIRNIREQNDFEWAKGPRG